MLIPLSEMVAKHDLKIRGVLHVGAHTCEESVAYAEQGIQKVIWIEANPDLVAQQKKLGFEIYECAASDKDDEPVSFKVTSNLQSSSILALDLHSKHYPDIVVTKELTLKTKRLDTLAAEQKWDMTALNFLNADVQGAELQVFQGLGDLLHGFDAIYTEINVAHLYKDCALVGEMDEYLGKYGFKRIETKMTDKQWGDALYLKSNILDLKQLSVRCIGDDTKFAAEGFSKVKNVKADVSSMIQCLEEQSSEKEWEPFVWLQQDADFFDAMSDRSFVVEIPNDDADAIHLGLSSVGIKSARRVSESMSCIPEMAASYAILILTRRFCMLFQRCLLQSSLQDKNVNACLVGNKEAYAGNYRILALNQPLFYFSHDDTTTEQTFVSKPIEKTLQVIQQAKSDSLGYDNCDSTSNGEFALLDSILKPNSVILDVGANVGSWSEHVLKIQPTSLVYAFEPLPTVFQVLKNKLGSKTQVFNMACSNKTGKAEFYSYADTANMSELSGFYQRQVLATKPTKIQVDQDTVDHFCETNKIQRIDFLKIDTEGAEELVIDGAAKLLNQKAISYMQFEYGGTYLDAKTTLQKVATTLTRHGYALFRISEKGLIHIQSWTSGLECMKYSNYLATVETKEYPKINNL